MRNYHLYPLQSVELLRHNTDAGIGPPLAAPWGAKDVKTEERHQPRFIGVMSLFALVAFALRLVGQRRLRQSPPSITFAPFGIEFMM